jgi:hypothetical protein
MRLMSLDLNLQNRKACNELMLQNCDKELSVKTVAMYLLTTFCIMRLRAVTSYAYFETKHNHNNALLTVVIFAPSADTHFVTSKGVSFL